MSGPLDGFPISVEVPVAWGDMDAFGHVNNTVYFRWFETARIAHLRAIGFVAGGDAGGVGPILASTSCRFRRALAFPDTITVGVRTITVTDDRFTHLYRVISHASGEIAAEGEGVVVAYDYAAGRKAPIPPDVRAAIERVEGR